jgi:hypothetical protein
MRPARFAALSLGPLCAVATSLLTCGPAPKKTAPDAGVDAGVGDLEAYFSVQKGRCFEYTTTESKQPSADLGVAVEEIDTVQFPVATRVVRYRQGFVRMTDYLAIEGSELKLYKRDFFGGKSYKFTPPLTLLKAPIKGNDRLESSAKTQVRDSKGTLLEEKDETLRVDTFEATEVALPAKNPVKTSKVIYDFLPSLNRAETRSFITGAGNPADIEGWGSLEFNFDNDESQPRKVYKLQTVRDLGDDAKAKAQPCGSAP